MKLSQQNRTIDFLDSYQTPDAQSRIECWHLDLDNPDKSFYQCR